MFFSFYARLLLTDVCIKILLLTRRRTSEIYIYIHVSQSDIQGRTAQY